MELVKAMIRAPRDYFTLVTGTVSVKVVFNLPSFALMTVVRVRSRHGQSKATRTICSSDPWSALPGLHRSNAILTWSIVKTTPLLLTILSNHNFWDPQNRPGIIYTCVMLSMLVSECLRKLPKPRLQPWHSFVSRGFANLLGCMFAMIVWCFLARIDGQDYERYHPLSPCRGLA